MKEIVTGILDLSGKEDIWFDKKDLRRVENISTFTHMVKVSLTFLTECQRALRSLSIEWARASSVVGS